MRFSLNDPCYVLCGDVHVLAGLFVLCSAEYDKYSEDPEFKPATRHSKDIFEEVGIQENDCDPSKT